MKIKTTMLSGVAGALALAALLSSATAYGAGHLIVPEVPTLESPLDDAYLDTSAGPITLYNQIQGDVEITNILPSDEGPEPTDVATVWIHQQVLETDILDPIDTEDQPYQQTLTPLTTGDYAGFNLLTSPISYGGEDNAQVGDDSGVIMDTNGNVWLNSTSTDEQSYRYDTTLYSYTFGTTDVDGDGNSLNGAPVYIDANDNVLYIETRPERGGSLESLPEGAILLTDEAVGVWVPNENILGGYEFVAYEGVAFDGGELTDGFKTFLAGYGEIETRYSGDAQGTTYYSAVVGEETGGNLFVEGNAQVQGDTRLDGNLKLGAIDDVEAAIDGNTSDIAVNASDIDVNASDIDVNASDIDVNASDIAVNASDIDVNAAAIVVNASDIDVNASDIDVNASDIDVNAAAIVVNASDIDVNAAAINVNASDIDVNAAAINVNASDIDVNAAAIVVNASDIDVNAAGIAVNASDIDVNAAGIAENAGDIEDLQGLIFVDPHGNTHISGPNSDSLYTRYDEEDGNQKLGAIHDMEGADHPNLVDIDVVTNLNVSGQGDAVGVFTVQKNDMPPTTDSDEILDPVAPFFDENGVVPGTVAVYTEKTDATVISETTDNSGFKADTDGNVWLYKTGGSKDTINYVTYVRQDIYDEDQGALAGTKQGDAEVGGYFDANGNFVELGVLIDQDGIVDGIGELDPSVFTPEVLAAMAAAGAYTTEEIDGAGGNLVVEGDGTIEGDLMIANSAGDAMIDVADTLAYHEGLVTTNISNIAVNASGIATNVSRLNVHEGLVTKNISDIAVNKAGIATNVSRLNVHEGLVTTNISNIAVNAAGIATNVSRLDVHEGLVMTNISNIAVNALGIAANVSRLDVHEGLVTKNISDIAVNKSAITAEASARAAAITAEATARASADSNLQSQISSNDTDIASLQGSVSSINSTLSQHFSLVSQNIQDIEKNTRGIAMTAALTHTTILPGMENALDISMAYFEGETGISISYSRRINEGTQINFAAASTTDFEETVVRGGIGWQW